MQQLKDLARALRKHASDIGVTMSHAQALEVLGRTGGFSTWASARAVMAKAADPSAMPQKSDVVSVLLNEFDDEGNQVDSHSMEMKLESVSDIIDHAAQFILLRRTASAEDIEACADDLEEALSVAGVIDGATLRADTVDARTSLEKALDAKADEVFEAYSFGDGVTVLASDGWQKVLGSDEASYRRTVYVKDAGDAPEDESHRVFFYVSIDPKTGAPIEVGDLDCDSGRGIGMLSTFVKGWDEGSSQEAPDVACTNPLPSDSIAPKRPSKDDLKEVAAQALGLYDFGGGIDLSVSESFNDEGLYIDKDGNHNFSCVIRASASVDESGGKGKQAPVRLSFHAVVNSVSGELVEAYAYDIDSGSEMGHMPAPKVIEDPIDKLRVKIEEGAREGWFLSEFGKETYRLEKIDDPDQVEKDLGVKIEHRWNSDAEVWNFVAENPSSLHTRALDILQATSPEEYANVLKHVASKERTLADLYALWGSLGDVPTQQDGQTVLDDRFLHFERGTPVEDVWHWFEAKSPEFIVGEVMQGKRRNA